MDDILTAIHCQEIIPSYLPLMQTYIRCVYNVSAQFEFNILIGMCTVAITRFLSHCTEILSVKNHNSWKIHR